jgi:hypothetical protein
VTFAFALVNPAFCGEIGNRRLMGAPQIRA